MDICLFSFLLKRQSKRVAKRTVSIPENTTKEISLKIPKVTGNLQVKINAKDAFLFDNTYFINLHNTGKIKVLYIGKGLDFLSRIYTKEEFNYTKRSAKQVDFNIIDPQNLIICNGLKSISNSLLKKLLTFTEKGGSLVVIPDKFDDKTVVNNFLQAFNMGVISSKITHKTAITKIHTNSPILARVFDKTVTNFQYPQVLNYYRAQLQYGNPVLSFENQDGFISQIRKNNGTMYWVSAPLNDSNSDFSKSPLVVPVFYNMAKQSIKQGFDEVKLQNSA